MEDQGYWLWRATMGLHSFSFNTSLSEEGHVKLLDHDFNFIKNNESILFREIEWEYIAYHKNERGTQKYRIISYKLRPTKIKYKDKHDNVREKNFNGRVTIDYYYQDIYRMYRMSIYQYLLEVEDDNFEERIKLNFADDIELYKIIGHRFQLENVCSKTKACR